MTEPYADDFWQDRGELVPGWEYRQSRDGIWQVRRKYQHSIPRGVPEGMRLSTQEWQDERSIPHTVRPWRPFEETIPYSNGSGLLKGLERFFANGHYLVFMRELIPSDPKDPIGFHLSLRTVENDTRHDWRDMQRIKNELCDPEWEAIELYPAESRLVDSANQYHLWVFQFQLPFGFRERFTKTPEEAAAIGASQRPREDT